MNESQKMWNSWIEQQPIDEAALKRIEKSINGIISKNSTPKKLSAVLAESLAIIIKQSRTLSARQVELSESKELLAKAISEMRGVCIHCDHCGGDYDYCAVAEGDTDDEDTDPMTDTDGTCRFWTWNGMGAANGNTD